MYATESRLTDDLDPLRAALQREQARQERAAELLLRALAEKRRKEVDRTARCGRLVTFAEY